MIKTDSFGRNPEKIDEKHLGFIVISFAQLLLFYTA